MAEPDIYTGIYCKYIYISAGISAIKFACASSVEEDGLVKRHDSQEMLNITL